MLPQFEDVLLPQRRVGAVLAFEEDAARFEAFEGVPAAFFHIEAAEVAAGVEDDRFGLPAGIVVEVPADLAAEDGDRFRGAAMPMDRQHRARLQRIEHPLRLVVRGIAQVHIHPQPGRRLRRGGELVENRLVDGHGLSAPRARPLLHNIRNPLQLILDVLQRGDLGLGFFEIQTASVVGVEFVDGGAFGVTILEILVVVQVAVVGGDGVEVAHVDGLGGLFLGQERFVHFFAVADADHLDVFFAAAKEFAHRLGLGLDGAGRRLLDQDVAVAAMLEGEEHEVHRLFEAHNEARHLGLGEGDGVALADLVDPERDHTAARAHHVAVAGAADLRVAGEARLGHGDLLLDGLADAHRVDGIRGLVGRQADHALHARVDRRVERVVGADDIRLDGLHREELATRHLLERRRVEHIVHALHRVLQRALVPHVTNIKFNLVRHLRHPRLEVVPHIVLLLLIAAEDPDLANISPQKTVQHRIAKAPGTAGDEQGFVFENGHMDSILLLSLLACKCSDYFIHIRLLPPKAERLIQGVGSNPMRTGGQVDLRASRKFFPRVVKDVLHEAPPQLPPPVRRQDHHIFDMRLAAGRAGGHAQRGAAHDVAGRGVGAGRQRAVQHREEMRARRLNGAPDHLRRNRNFGIELAHQGQDLPYLRIGDGLEADDFHGCCCLEAIGEQSSVAPCYS